ncbi:hypothetical protein [Saccharomonospora sp.]|uniref:hypothetical protein n=1 Tax=Saccharomonospora sp. TaxID=33913 RepID=UPI0023093F34|nr:hypothetical protein [Saccharomonospora sp.]MDA8370289.1 hypothetical protein [Nocardiopsaceae bacterium]
MTEQQHDYQSMYEDAWDGWYREASEDAMRFVQGLYPIAEPHEWPPPDTCEPTIAPLTGAEDDKTHAEQLAAAETEARRLESEVARAFGISPATAARFSLRPTGIQFVQPDGHIWWFPRHGLTPEQEQAVVDLFQHFPQRVWTSMP